MTSTVKQGATHTSVEGDVVRQFGAIPSWLAAALDRDAVMAALNRYVPEFADGTLTLRNCAIDKIHLKDNKGQWERTWLLTVDGPDGEGEVPVRVTFTAPGMPTPEPPSETLPFGVEGWSCWLPEQRMLFRRWRSKRNKDKDLPALAELTDAERALPLLQATLREQAEGYEEVTISSCAPEVLVNKPGDSAIVRYRLGYGPEAAGRNWRDTIILKAYRDDLGRNAIAGMQAVWRAGLKNSSVVTVPEPLGYLPEHQSTLQGPVPEEYNLEKRMLTILLSDDPAHIEELHQSFAAAGAALAAFHTCGATAGEETTWEETFALAQEQIDWLRVPFPGPIAAFEDLVARLRALRDTLPADPLVPSHGAFRPEQVLVDHGRIGFIDFDRYCQAEPAHDLALFRATVMDSGLYDSSLPHIDEAERARRTERLDALNETFLAAYAAHAPVSRQRVALWEAIHYINDALQRWSKPHPADQRLGVAILERNLRGLGLIEG